VETMLERFVPIDPAGLVGTAPGKLRVETVLHTVQPEARAQADMGQDEIDRLLNG